MPKCLTEVNGEPILEQQLDALVRNNVRDITIVIGYLSERIKALLDGYDEARLTFIENPDYATTNSAYSLYLARKQLRDGCIILEGDVVFEPAVLASLLSYDESIWLVDRVSEGDDGCLVKLDDNNRVIEAKILHEPLKQPEAGWWKSVGIQKLTAEHGELLADRLECIPAGRFHKDEIILPCFNCDDIPIYARSIQGMRWAEIDTVADLRVSEKRFEPTKLVMVIMDGAADDPQYDHEGKTPLELASTPVLDALTAEGRTGLVQTMYTGLPLGSVVACLGLLGYNPTRYYPNGRASFEAIANDIYLAEDEIAFRCNLVTHKDGILIDATPTGLLGINAFADPDLGFKFYPGQDYRNILVAKACCKPEDLFIPEPHTKIGSSLDELFPEPCNSEGYSMIFWLGVFTHRNRGLDYAFIPWSPSSAPHLPSFCKRHDLDGAIVSAMDFMRGIGKVARLQADRIDGATGYSDTDLEAKLTHAKNALRYNDFVLIHINAPDEESHKRDPEGKVASIERIDSELLSPLRAHLDAEYANNYRLAVLPDHYSYVATGKHGGEPVPYTIYGKGVEAERVSTILKSYEFLDFLRGGI